LIKASLSVAVLASLAACTSTDEAAHWMKAHPVHDVKIGGYALFACNGISSVGRYYSAIDNFSGEPVHGTICTNLDNSTSDVTAIKGTQ